MVVIRFIKSCEIHHIQPKKIADVVMIFKLFANLYSSYDLLLFFRPRAIYSRQYEKICGCNLSLSTEEFGSLIRLWISMLIMGNDN